MDVSYQDIQKLNLSVEHVFEKLVSTDNDLSSYFHEYIQQEYDGDLNDRLVYYDIARIGDYIINMLSENKTENFPAFFSVVEEILCDNNLNAKNLIIVGLFESLQNQEKGKLSYSRFNKWLHKTSKKEWDGLIDFWKGRKKRKKK